MPTPKQRRIIHFSTMHDILIESAAFTNFTWKCSCESEGYIYNTPGHGIASDYVENEALVHIVEPFGPSRDKVVREMVQMRRELTELVF